MDEQEILDELSALEEFPLTEKQQRIVNYVRSNVEDLVEAFDDEA